MIQIKMIARYVNPIIPNMPNQSKKVVSGSYPNCD